jgi:hypothetical protein
MLARHRHISTRFDSVAFEFEDEGCDYGKVSGDDAHVFRKLGN